jgi:hypothetical protein
MNPYWKSTDMPLSPKMTVLHYEDVSENTLVESEENATGWDGPEDPQNPYVYI